MARIARRRTPPRTSAHRSLLDIEHLPLAEIQSILKESSAMQKALAASASRKRLRKLLDGRRVALLFFEASTRTRVSFELAAKNLGAVTTVVTSSASSIEKGESLADTALNLEAMGAEALVVRHPSSGAAQMLAGRLRIPVLNAGDGSHEHPSQALLDAFTMLQHRKSLKDLAVTITGDIAHSRVARSNVQLLAKFGARITLCGPPELLPDFAASLAPGVRLERDFDRALRGASIVMMLRIQKERLAGLDLDLAEYIRRYQLTVERLSLAAEDALVMHPGPVMREVEMTSEMLDGPRCIVLEQVANGTPVRMALLRRALA